MIVILKNRAVQLVVHKPHVAHNGLPPTTTIPSLIPVADNASVFWIHPSLLWLLLPAPTPRGELA